MNRIVWSLEKATLSKAGNKSAPINKCRQKLWSAPGRHFLERQRRKCDHCFALGKQGIACSADLPEPLCIVGQCLGSPPALCCGLKVSSHISQMPRPRSDKYRMGGRQMAELGNWDVALQMGARAFSEL